MALSANPDGTGYTIHVAKTGNDSNEGSFASPKLTIASAVIAAGSDQLDWIVIHNGTYADEAIDTTKSIIFHGLTRTGTILTFGAANNFGPFDGAKQIVVRNMTLNRTNGNGLCIQSYAGLTKLIGLNMFSAGDDTASCEGPTQDGTDGACLVDDCFITTTGADALATICQKNHIRDTQVICVGTATGGTVALIQAGQYTTIERSLFRVEMSGAQVDDHITAAEVFGRLNIVDSVFEARLLGASSTKAAYGIRSVGVRTLDNTTPIYITMKGGAIITQNAGSGADINILGSTQINATLANVDHATAKLSGSLITNLVTQVRAEMDSNSTQLASINTKTGQLTFTETNKVDATADATLSDQDKTDIAQEVADLLGDEVGGTLVITPLLAAATNPRYSRRNLSTIAAGSAPTDILTITDATGTAIDLSEKTLAMVVYLQSGEEDGYEPVNDQSDPFDATLTRQWQYDTGTELSIIGDDDNQVQIEHDPQKTATAGYYRYWLWDMTDPATPIVLVKGRMPIEPSVVPV